MDAKVLSKMQTLCSRREYCSRDIFQKALKALDGNETAAAEVLEALVAEKYVDDRRYACAFARDKAVLTGWGPVKIAFQLGAKGIPRDIIREAVEEAAQEEDASAKLRKVLEAKYRTLEGDPQARLKLLRFGLSRGYEYDDISALVAQITARKDG